MSEKNRKLMEGCEHDGSFIPVGEVDRLMDLARVEERKLVSVRLASESVDLQFLEELLIKHIKRTDRFLRKDKRKVKDNFVFGKRYMAKKILSAIHTEMNKAEKEAKKNEKA